MSSLLTSRRPSSARRSPRCSGTIDYRLVTDDGAWYADDLYLSIAYRLNSDGGIDEYWVDDVLDWHVGGRTVKSVGQIATPAIVSRAQELFDDYGSRYQVEMAIERATDC